MTYKLSWKKDFPCRNCLMKHKCSKLCFQEPMNTTDAQSYVESHDELKGICLACGGPREEKFYWACGKCNETIRKW